MIKTNYNTAPTTAEHKESGTFEPVPDGKYVAQLARISFNRTKRADRPRISFAYRVTAGPQSGRWIWDNVLIDNEQGIEICKRKLQSLCPLYSHTDGVQLIDEAQEVALWLGDRALQINYYHTPAGYDRLYVNSIG